MSLGQGTISLPTPMCLSVQHSPVHFTRTTHIHSLLPHFTLQRVTMLAHFASYVYRSQSIPPPDGPGTAYARMPSCPCDPRTLLAWVDFRSTPTVAKTLEQVLPRRCHSTVCPSYGLVVIVSEDSSRRWSGDVCPDTLSSVSVTESRCNLAQCILDFT